MSAQTFLVTVILGLSVIIVGVTNCKQALQLNRLESFHERAMEE